MVLILFNIQKNSGNRTHTGIDRCQIIEYSWLSDGTYTDPSSYRVLFVTVLYLGCTIN